MYFIKIPNNRELAAQYLLLYELSLPYGLDLNDRININKSETRVTATLENVSTIEIRKFKNDPNNGCVIILQNICGLKRQVRV